MICFRPLSGSYISQSLYGVLRTPQANSFRPLSGSYISQWYRFVSIVTPVFGFRPLSGSYISQSFFIIFSNFSFCFRPLSGSYISQWKRRKVLRIRWKFPSPIGELHFSIMEMVVLIIENSKFPSPIGELHFSMVLVDVSLFCNCSFPSPIGELHFSILNNSINELVDMVSVPYRGATFLNDIKSYSGTKRITFPSPIGELHFSIPSPQPQSLSGTN